MVSGPIQLSILTALSDGVPRTIPEIGAATGYTEKQLYSCAARLRDDDHIIAVEQRGYYRAKKYTLTARGKKYVP